jgi:CubicO group peptidase (beta-lactamase class C family)
MRRYLVAIAMSLSAMTAMADPVAAPATPPAVNLSADVSNAITERFTRFQQESHAPGVVWGIVYDGRLIQVGTAGVQDLDSGRPVTADTVFRIASMSKAFTALAILKLRDAGRLSLDAPLERYIPEARGWHYPTSDSPRLRVRDLLGHTSGFGPDDPWSDRQQPMSEVTFTGLLGTGFSFNHPPQTAYEYSSLNYALLGRVITNVSKTRYDRYISREILQPLGMKASGYEIADVPADRLAIGYRWENDVFAREPAMANGVFGAMGGVYTSANDYARWVAFLLSAWPARDGAETGPAHRASVRELAVGTSFPRLNSRPRAGTAGPCAFATVYAAGFNVVRDCDLGLVLTHNGGYPGYGSTVLLMPEYGIGIFAFDNRTYAAPTAAVFDVAQLLKNAGLLTPRSIGVSDALAQAYARAGAMFHAGDLKPGLDDLAVNFTLDRSAENWSKEFSRLKDKVGTCAAQEPIIATGLLSGSFTWSCEHGTLRGGIELSPTTPPRIQSLTLTPVAGK